MYLPVVVSGQKIIEKTYLVKAEDNINLQFEFADSIAITGWDKNEVYVKVSVSINGNENNDNFKLDMSQNAVGIEIESEIENMKELQRHKRIIDDDGHTIICNSVDMDLFFEVKVPKNCWLEVKTISGDIDIKNLLGKMEIETISGYIDISLPANHNADLELSTISGEMFSNFDFESKAPKGYHHYGRNNVSKVLNQGGKRITLETISGDIYIRKVK